MVVAVRIEEAGAGRWEGLLQGPFDLEVVDEQLGLVLEGPRRLGRFVLEVHGVESFGGTLLPEAHGFLFLAILHQLFEGRSHVARVPRVFAQPSAKFVHLEFARDRIEGFGPLVDLGTVDRRVDKDRFA